MVSPLNLKVAAGAVALMAGILGGAYVAGATSTVAQTPELGSTTPSRVASPSGLPSQTLVADLGQPASVKQHDQHLSEHAKHHRHRDDNNN